MPQWILILSKSILVSAVRLKILNEVFIDKTLKEKVKTILAIYKSKKYYLNSHIKNYKKLQTKLLKGGINLDYIEYLKKNQLYSTIVKYFYENNMMDKETYEIVMKKIEGKVKDITDKVSNSTELLKDIDSNYKEKLIDFYKENQFSSLKKQITTLTTSITSASTTFTSTTANTQKTTNNKVIKPLTTLTSNKVTKTPTTSTNNKIIKPLIISTNNKVIKPPTTSINNKVPKTPTTLNNNEVLPKVEKFTDVPLVLINNTYYISSIDFKYFIYNNKDKDIFNYFNENTETTISNNSKVFNKRNSQLFFTSSNNNEDIERFLPSSNNNEDTETIITSNNGKVFNKRNSLEINLNNKEISTSVSSFLSLSVIKHITFNNSPILLNRRLFLNKVEDVDIDSLYFKQFVKGNKINILRKEDRYNNINKFFVFDIYDLLRLSNVKEYDKNNVLQNNNLYTISPNLQTFVDNINNINNNYYQRKKFGNILLGKEFILFNANIKFNELFTILLKLFPNILKQIIWDLDNKDKNKLLLFINTNLDEEKEINILKKEKEIMLNYINYNILQETKEITIQIDNSNVEDYVLNEYIKNLNNNNNQTSNNSEVINNQTSINSEIIKDQTSINNKIIKDQTLNNNEVIRDQTLNNNEVIRE
ncbi:hypothetical protein ABK040_001487 [Willaertia magna]